MTFRRICLPLLLAAVLAPALAAAPPDDDLGPVGDFRLTERSGRTVTAADLDGKVWVASFVFVRCTAGCPQVTTTMKQLQDDLRDLPDFRLVTFTVDPGHDTAAVLARYADAFGADRDRWLFLTGPEAELARLLRDGFHVHAARRPWWRQRPGYQVDHWTGLVLVDRHGHIRGTCSGLRPERMSEADFQAEVAALEAKARELHQEGRRGAGLDFPFVNAVLNAASGALLLLGYAAIRLRRRGLHVACMLSALCVSAVFLTSYLYYHIAVRHGQPTRFADQAPGAPGWAPYAYLTILATHTVLAVVVTPAALYAAYLGLRDRLTRHVWLARWVLPVWLYVSVTGVVVYVMLYRLWAPG
jgi:protein SCO1/2/putative membrane protein